MPISLSILEIIFLNHVNNEDEFARNAQKITSIMNTLLVILSNVHVVEHSRSEFLKITSIMKNGLPVMLSNVHVDEHTRRDFLKITSLMKNSLLVMLSSLN